MDDEVAVRLAYLSAQESLLEEWQQRAIKAEDALANFPGHDELRRVNARVIELQAALDASVRVAAATVDDSANVSNPK